MADFKTMLIQLRKAKGLTQEELAKQIGTSRSRISMYELGEREPDFETTELIADFFNVDVDYLLGRSTKTTVIPETYYLNKDAREVAEFMHRSRGHKELLDAVCKVREEDIDLVRQMIERISHDQR